MNGNFNENQPGYYEVQNIAEIEDFDKDDYGNTWYNVKFVGGADTYLWLAKNKPEEGKQYYGHLEPTKSGKRLRFKTDKVPDDERSTKSQEPKPAYKDNSKNITLGLVWKTIAGIRGLPEPGDDADFAKFYEMVDAHYTELILMQEKGGQNET